MSLGKRIHSLRKEKGMTQEMLAQRLEISRQAVAKWESDRSAPSRENLVKLAAVLETSVDALVASTEGQPEFPSQESQVLSVPDAVPGVKRRIWAALLLLAGYLSIYLLGRILGDIPAQSSVLGWLFTTSPSYFSYLYGWLIKSKLFWVAVAISLSGCLLGRYRFAVTTFCAFAVGLVLGELLGENPSGAPYGHGHYGWVIWGCVFIFSLVMGAVVERFPRRGAELWRYWGFRLWLGSFLVCILLLLLWALLLAR